MGFQREFNWYIVDKRDPSELETLTVGATGLFNKKDYREYPLDTPLFLLDSAWNVLGAAEVTSYTPGNQKTIVNYKIIDIFNSEERKVLTDIVKRIHKK